MQTCICIYGLITNDYGCGVPQKCILTRLSMAIKETRGSEQYYLCLLCPQVQTYWIHYFLLSQHTDGAITFGKMSIDLRYVSNTNRLLLSHSFKY